jgi:hypothetical protein
MPQSSKASLKAFIHVCDLGGPPSFSHPNKISLKSPIHNHGCRLAAFNVLDAFHDRDF